MSDQVTNKSVAAEQSQVGMVETALPFSMPPSDKMLSRITILLFILVAGLLTVFGYYASSICITVILAGFLAILFDPLVVILEKLHLPHSVAAAGIVLAGMSLVGLLGYALYGKGMSFAEELPVYASKFSKPLNPLLIAARSKTFSKVPEILRTACIPPRKSRKFGCRNRQTGLIIWCAVWDLCGEC